MATNQARRSGYGQNKSTGTARAGATSAKSEIPETTHTLKVHTGDGNYEYVNGSFLTIDQNQVCTFLKLNLKNGLEPGSYVINVKKGYNGELSI